MSTIEKKKLYKYRQAILKEFAEELRIKDHPEIFPGGTLEERYSWAMGKLWNETLNIKLDALLRM